MSPEGRTVHPIGHVVTVSNQRHRDDGHAVQAIEAMRPWISRRRVYTHHWKVTHEPSVKFDVESGFVSRYHAWK